MISCIIVEDQAPAQRLLKKYISDVKGLDLRGVFGDALEAIEFLSSNTVDLIFLDIHLPKLSGLDFMSILSPKPMVVLTTAFSDYALQGYELDVVDYLLKPFTFERFYKAVLKVERLNNKKGVRVADISPVEETIVVKVGRNYLKVNINDVVYMKSEGDYTHIITLEKKYLTLNPLKYWMENLSSKRFCQVHRSFLVNLEHITEVAGNVIYVFDVEIPIGRVYKKHFVDCYLK